MKKFISALFLVVIVSLAQAQTDTLSQAQRNEQKVTELKEKIKNLSSTPTENESASTIVPRLGRMEDMMTELLAEMKSMKEQQAKLLEDSQKLSKLRDSLQRANTRSSSREITSGDLNRVGEFYVIIESQRTKELAQKALEMSKKKGNENVLLLKSNVSDWYYLAVPETQNYKQTLQLVNKKRAAGFDDAWWVESNDVDVVN